MYTLKSLETRWANAENPRGEKSRGGLAGNGRKGAPCVQDFKPHTTLTLLDQQGPGLLWGRVQKLSGRRGQGRQELLF